MSTIQCTLFSGATNDIVLLKPELNARSVPTLTAPLKAGDAVVFRDHRKVKAEDIIGQPYRSVVAGGRRALFRIYEPTLGQYCDNSPRVVTPIYSADANLIVSLLDLNFRAVPSAESAITEEKERLSPSRPLGSEESAVSEDGENQESVEGDLLKSTEPPNKDNIYEPLEEIIDSEIVEGWDTVQYDTGNLEIFEAGTGHGSLTLHLARAIHGANTRAPAIPKLPKTKGKVDADDDIYRHGGRSSGRNVKTMELYEEWRSRRRAVIHTLDSDEHHSRHAQKTVRNYRHGAYFPHVDFHIGSIHTYLSKRLAETKDVFLDHAILDIPATQDEMEILGKCIKPDGRLITWCPSITQHMKCLETVKGKKLPFVLDKILEVGSQLSTGGREWEVRQVKPRALIKAEKKKMGEKLAQADKDDANFAVDAFLSQMSDKKPETSATSEYSFELSEDGENSGSKSDAAQAGTLEADDLTDTAGWEMICRPKVGDKINGGGFIGVWKKMDMTVRTATQLGALALFTIIVLWFLDNQYRVLPSAIHDYMPAHHPGLVITDITVTKCSKINLFTSCKLDSDKWHRIEKDLYLGRGWVNSAYMHVQRKKEEELTSEDKVVMDVSVGRLDPATATKGESDERWESRPAGLWLKRSAKRHASDSNKAVNSVDVLFGADAVDPRDGWEMTGTPLLLDSSGEVQEARLSIRRGKLMTPIKPTPRIRDNGKFKILQAADLHLSTGTGECRDAMPEDGGNCEADPRTLEFVGRILDEEKPDMIILSGDQINGETAPDAQSAIFKYAELFIKRKIPFATIFGNHDDEGSLPRAQQMALVESLPYSLSEAGPEELEGVGNYIVEVLAQGGSKHSALTIYLLDTHSYSPDERSFKGYDWLKKNQIDWFKQTAEGLKRAHEGYTHIHMDLAFIHIPLPEYRDDTLYKVGEWREGVTAPGFNSGFRDALVEQGVVMVSCGHDHANEYCSLSLKEDKSPALWMCYGGGAGFGGYGGYGGYHRRLRLFEIDMNEAKIVTYKRLEYGDVEKRIDEQILVEGGKPITPSP
ncbi:phosphatase dcr2 [Sclerotinia borealis F-4128]|uniref:tRNA (adenine(58)-N(1))-methyltransferase catalytic subunit TRM61 n=1 Tax=Sclerotinia borealis (strain F-4128) TaxID=1432307 RepID=W9CN80_SCLBF|nr:phosphatase dcr2 [Sclerotinia borealis F-4128]